jgi:hypothetical protein
MMASLPPLSGWYCFARSRNQDLVELREGKVAGCRAARDFPDEAGAWCRYRRGVGLVPLTDDEAARAA